VFGSCFLRSPGLRGEFHVLLTKYASAFLSTGVFGVRRTTGHPGTRLAMCGAGAELDVVFAQPGFQQYQQSSTNGLARQHQHNATKQENLPEKHESGFPFKARTTHRLHWLSTRPAWSGKQHHHAWEAIPPPTLGAIRECSSSRRRWRPAKRETLWRGEGLSQGRALTEGEDPLPGPSARSSRIAAWLPIRCLMRYRPGAIPAAEGPAPCLD
jgi:hypothetical protein